MKATALLILLVAIVCTSEALECYNTHIGKETCPDVDRPKCMHYRNKETGKEYRKCGSHRECSETDADMVSGDVPNAQLNCCDNDLCNVWKMDCPEV